MNIIFTICSHLDLACIIYFLLTHMRVLSMGHDDMIYLSYFENEMALTKQVVLTQKFK